MILACRQKRTSASGMNVPVTTCPGFGKVCPSPSLTVSTVTPAFTTWDRLDCTLCTRASALRFRNEAKGLPVNALNRLAAMGRVGSVPLPSKPSVSLPHDLSICRYPRCVPYDVPAVHCLRLRTCFVCLFRRFGVCFAHLHVNWDDHLIQILAGTRSTTHRSRTTTPYFPRCSDTPVEECPNASTPALQRRPPSVSLRGTLTLGSGCPIPRRAPTLHRLFARRAATLCTSPEEAGEVSRGNRGRSGVTGGEDAVLDDHQVRNGTHP